MQVLAVELLLAMDEAKAKQESDQRVFDREQREDFDIRLSLVSQGVPVSQAFPDRYLSDDDVEDRMDYSGVDWVSPTEGSTVEEFEETQRLLMAMVNNQRVGVPEESEGAMASADSDREWV